MSLKRSRMNKGNLYFIKDEYFEKFLNQKLLTNKEITSSGERNRPCYYAFQDEENPEVKWMIPISLRVEKFEKKYEQSVKRYGQCDVLTFGFVKGNRNVFSIQNMCPVTERYILNEYMDAQTGNPIYIASDTRREINAKVRKIIRLHKKGISLAHADILWMKEQLLNELNEG